ncbi:dienelactone hydrolase [Mumia flava]|uniref:Dienelactone hydrolase n=1 Tax=Mumia flava TaxID=1348852 RepID=A0A2M9BGS8_9ACTN|nr:alpha/beta fold hydrolase [Mumia flava]PJJ57160.1 dienelactone hydrolase [Mumia flava]
MFTRLATRLAALLAVVALPLVGVSSAGAVENGPAPNGSNILGSGPYSVRTDGVSGWFVSGFGGGDIYRPSTGSNFGAVVFSPGFTATASMYSGLARRVASHGFVVLVIDTNTTLDQPDSRGRQILAGVDYLTRSWSGRSQIDTSRVAVAGHSMGGGGTLYAAENGGSNVKAAVALQPWHTDKTWYGVDVPTMIIGAQSDTIAPVSSHSERFYATLSGAPEKAYAELRLEDHLAANTDPDDQGALMVSWLKRYLDGDTRYSSVLCPLPSTVSSQLSEYRDTCPA